MNFLRRRKIVLAVPVVIGLMLAVGSSVTVGAGESNALDRTFAGDGVLRISYGSGKASADAVVDGLVQRDGKFVIVGGGSVPYRGRYPNETWSILRLNRDGRIDRSFGSNGRTLTQFPRDRRGPLHSNVPADAVLQRDGKIVVVGSIDISTAGDIGDDPNPEGEPDYEDTVAAVARYRTDGGLDRTFGSNGVFISRVCGHDNLWRSEASSVAVDGRGRIVFTASAESLQSKSRFAIARLTPSGRYDESFGKHGRVCMPATSTDRGALNGTIAVRGDDGLVVGGGYTEWVDAKVTRGRWQLVGLTSSGKFDRHFGRNGRTVVTVGGDHVLRDSTVYVDSLTVARSGRIYAFGCTPCGSENWHEGQHSVGRFTPDGRLDAAYGKRGLAQVERDNAPAQRLYGFALDDQGRALVVGNLAQQDSPARWFVARLTSTGGDDPGFGFEYPRGLRAVTNVVAPSRFGTFVAGDIYNESLYTSDIFVARLSR